LDENIDVSDLVKPRHAVQWIGKCGRGKTSQLLGWSARIPTSEYVYLPEDGPCPAIPSGEPLIIDEAQRLPRRIRRDIFSSGLPLVLATHRNLSMALRRYGYEVCTVQLGRSTSAPHVQTLMNTRLEYCRKSFGPLPQLSLEDACWLIRRFGSDIRAMENHLYDQVQTQAYNDGEMQFTGRA